MWREQHGQRRKEPDSIVLRPEHWMLWFIEAFSLESLGLREAIDFLLMSVLFVLFVYLIEVHRREFVLEADIGQHSSLFCERQERIFFNFLLRTPRTDLLLLSLKLYFLHFIISIKSPQNLLPLPALQSSRSLLSHRARK